MENVSFGRVWQLLSPEGEYCRRKMACERMWGTFSAERQNAVYHTLQTKKAQGQYVSPNPYFAIDDNAYPPEPQTLSYAEYYARYHTTEARDGWHMANPTGEKVIYVKGG